MKNAKNPLCLVISLVHLKYGISNILMQELWFLYSVRLTILINISMKFHEYSFDGADTIL